MPGKNLKIVKKFAQDYDKSVLINNWNGPKVIFDDLKEYLVPETKILDLGIGTGESSKRFQKMGFEITGIDGSPEMLKQCKKKQIGFNLILHNLENPPFPVENNSFDAVISNGVFHLINPLEPIFSEVKRILKPNRIFAFTFEHTNNILGYKEIEPGVWEMKIQAGVLTYKHSNTFIFNQLNENEFEIFKQKQFLAYTNPEFQKQYYFTVIVAKLK
ncbi:MAG: methyltransferase domain-containing protein [Draconibacterium sp.]|nr:methyltransferase domain-containing protein [Draconibacterium sp.]